MQLSLETFCAIILEHCPHFVQNPYSELVFHIYGTQAHVNQSINLALHIGVASGSSGTIIASERRSIAGKHLEVAVFYWLYKNKY